MLIKEYISYNIERVRELKHNLLTHEDYWNQRIPLKIQNYVNGSVPQRARWECREQE